MKKFYIIAAAVAVSMSASAQFAPFAPQCVPAPGSVSFERRADVAKAPVMAAPVASLSDVTGLYDYSCYSGGEKDYFDATLNISAVSGKENTIRFNGVRWTDISFDGVVDLEKGTITCPIQKIYEFDGYNIYLMGVTPQGSTYVFNPSEEVTFTIEADGSIVADGIVGFGLEDGSNGIGIFEDLKFTRSEKNAYVSLNLYQNDGSSLLDKTAPASFYAKATVSGGKVYLTKFITSTGEMVIDVDAAAKTCAVAQQVWDNVDLTSGGTAKVGIVGMDDDWLSQTSPALGEIAGSAEGNVISWTQPWGLMATSGESIIGWYLAAKGCKIVMSTNIDGTNADGVADVVAADGNAPVEYYNLQGVRVAEPASGLYIRRQGNNVTKVLIK